jgi:hypothetical protein
LEHAMAEAGSSNARALKKDSAERDARTELLAGSRRLYGRVPLVALIRRSVCL